MDNIEVPKFIIRQYLNSDGFILLYGYEVVSYYTPPFKTFVFCTHHSTLHTCVLTMTRRPSLHIYYLVSSIYYLLSYISIIKYINAGRVFVVIIHFICRSPPCTDIIKLHCMFLRNMYFREF